MNSQQSSQYSIRTPAPAVYAVAALREIPRLLGSVDRNPYRRTYGCFDRQFWHYRTASFASEMYQEGVLPLALVYARDLPGARWQGDEEVRKLVIAGMLFSARSCHRDGSCDDYYPFERALGAAVFSFAAATEACRLIGLSERDREFGEISAWLRLRAEWINQHGESGTLTNHHALAALGLARLAEWTGETRYDDAATHKLKEVLDWQDGEGWFSEYGGADPGYQTVTIDCLAKLRQLFSQSKRFGNELRGQLEDALCRGVRFAELFLHPDDTYGGAYGSRGTLHFYPHGFEALAGSDLPAASHAARLAAAFRRAMRDGKIGQFDDDRMYVHRLGNLLEAHGAASCTNSPLDSLYAMRSATRDTDAFSTSPPQVTHLASAKVLVVQTQQTHTIISAARGGAFTHCKEAHRHEDAGLIVEFADGRIAVSQTHDRDRVERFRHLENENALQYSVRAPLHFARFECMTPFKQTVLQMGMITLGRFCRTLVRRLLQKRTITGRRVAPVILTRRFDLRMPSEGGASHHTLRVTDHVELTDRKTTIKRMSFAGPFEAAYVAASGVFREGALAPWTALDADVAELNAYRRVEIIREFPMAASVHNDETVALKQSLGTNPAWTGRAA